MRLALTGGVLIDGTGTPPRRDATLLVEGGKIAAVTRERVTGPDVRVVELAGRTVMPGLIDTHVHFAPWGMNLIGAQDRSLMLLAAETRPRAPDHSRGRLHDRPRPGRPGRGLPRGRGPRADRRPAAGREPGHRLAHQRHRGRHDRARARLADRPRDAQPRVQRPVRRAREGAGGAPGRAPTSSRSPPPAASARRRSSRAGRSSPARRSRRSWTRPTWPGCRSPVTRSAGRAC